MQYNPISEDVEMTASKNEPEAVDDDEEMEDDLFGNDNDVEEHKRLRSVQNSEFGLSCHLCYFTPVSRTPASPTASGPDSERLPSPERERRQALEYEEEDAPPEISVEVKEAHVSFPNLPVPKSSDGNVRARLILIPFDSFFKLELGHPSAELRQAGLKAISS